MKILSVFPLMVFLFPGFASSQNIEGYLLVTLGKDTVGAEHYEIKGDVVESESIRLINTITKVKNKTVFNDQGSILSDQILSYDLKDSLVDRLYREFREDSLITERGMEEDRTRRSRPSNAAEAPHLLPAQFFVFGNCGKMIHTYERSPQQAYFFGGNPLSITKIDKGKYKLYSALPETFFIETNSDYQVMKVHSEGAGGGLSLRAGAISTELYEELIDKWLNDPNTKAVSTVSPRIQSSFTIRDTEFELDYFSPQKRGRKIFGGLVPYNKRWRTGSNWATHITFDSDLVFEGQVIPKGTYTVFTIPQPDQWTFLLNKQTRQWGTIYDESQEVLRFPMEVSNANPEMEAFEIVVEETADGGAIAIKWDKVKASIPFQLRE